MRLAIIGAGAAGYFAAVHVSELAPESQVTLFEASGKTLSKVRISGGGRCNVTHDCPDIRLLAGSYPRGNKELLGLFHRFGVEETVQWFEAHGVPLKTEPDGRIFPQANTSSAITDCFEKTASENGVKLETNCPVQQVTVSETGMFHLVLEKDKCVEAFDAVLLATGGSPMGFRLAEELGHTIMPPVPSIFTFKIQDPRIEGLAGISIPAAELTLVINGKTVRKERGPLLITHWGLSGPVVLKLSAWAARELHACQYRAQLQVNFLSDPPSHGYGSNVETVGYHEASLGAYLQLRKKKQPGARVLTGSGLQLPRRLLARLLEYSGIEEETIMSALSNKQITAWMNTLLRSEFAICGKGVFKEEFVTCGGVSLKEVDFKTMESKIHPGLYVAGEVLDVDGITGGFNFQSAWAGAWMAAESMACRT